MLLSITSVIEKALDFSYKVRMVDLNFSSTFDRVNHKVLIFKLKRGGVGSPFLGIFIEILI